MAGFFLGSTWCIVDQTDTSSPWKLALQSKWQSMLFPAEHRAVDVAVTQAAEASKSIFQAAVAGAATKVAGAIMR